PGGAGRAAAADPAGGRGRAARRAAGAGGGPGRLRLRARGEVLHEVSFRVPAGSTVALGGPPGSRQSTLARLPAPDRGRIRLGGRDLAKLDGGELAAAMSIAFQEPFLFSTSVTDNI